MFLAAKENMVLMSSTEMQMKDALQGKSSGRFTQGLPAAARETVVDNATIGSFYLDFEQVAKVMENLGGMLAMFAPQESGKNTLLQPENLASIKKMGKAVGSVTVMPGVIQMQSFYQPITNPGPTT